ncbi:acidic leucine-rich nuclear phosphoprotein 32 family member B-like [Haliotis asinina]|uniref:acidic leucine-rich nuclear phosphoprotein 32 family member B-like n=1 Tax=Haliotis asinina TaxID=109174 RepID=UPI003531D193
MSLQLLLSVFMLSVGMARGFCTARDVSEAGMEVLQERSSDSQPSIEDNEPEDQDQDQDQDEDQDEDPDQDEDGNEDEDAEESPRSAGIDWENPEEK